MLQISLILDEYGIKSSGMSSLLKNETFLKSNGIDVFKYGKTAIAVLLNVICPLDKLIQAFWLTVWLNGSGGFAKITL